ncbi:DMT family transporter [Roseospirillum parvum]|uniref:EamA domain-containing membrane protein RarD n=1 Tax=Roseospirillum parvum TaxID=83401 RepID=A0A1G8BXW4_9PROT|nr:DMT family transporter [Roseospirillum parvum]SDH37954.1 EamA domain-containing membrane protein RarD [Roseospirillum parvum]
MSAGGYARGIALSVAGMVVISPDGLMMRLLEGTAPLEAAFARSLFMGLALWGWLAARHRRALPRAVRRIGWPGLASAAIVAWGNILFTLSILNTTVANTLFMLALMPLSAALLGRLLIGEAVRRRTWVAIAAAFVGVVVIVGDGVGGVGLSGNLYGLLLSLVYGLNLVVLRHAKDVDMTPALALGATLAVPLALLLGAQPATIPAADWPILALIGLVLTPIGLGLFFAGARHVPAAEVALLALVETLLGPLWTWLGVGETPTWLALAGGLLVVAAVGGNALAGMRANRRRT